METKITKQEKTTLIRWLALGAAVGAILFTIAWVVLRALQRVIRPTNYTNIYDRKRG